jgi:hypothetical protein
MSAVTKLHNLPEVLLDYRIHPHQISRRQNMAQQMVSSRIRQEQMARLNLVLSPEEQQVFVIFTTEAYWRRLRANDYKRIIALIRTLFTQAQHKQLSLEAVQQVLLAQWSMVLEAAGRYQFKLLPLFICYPLGGISLEKRGLVRALKCFIGWRPFLPQYLKRYWRHRLLSRST